MSYDISLYNANTDPGEVVEVERHEDGGTYVLGGTTEAHLDITYNYSWFYYHLIDKEQGIRWLYLKQAKDCIERLETAIAALPEPRKHSHDEDTPPRDPNDPTLNRLNGKAFVRATSSYWCPTPENAAAPLRILLAWAKQHPEAVFDGD